MFLLVSVATECIDKIIKDEDFYQLMLVLICYDLIINHIKKEWILLSFHFPCELHKNYFPGEIEVYLTVLISNSSDNQIIHIFSVVFPVIILLLSSSQT